jgi:hypothetical protein
MTCPVDILMIFRQGRAGRAVAGLPPPCLAVLVSSGLIISADSRNLRQLTLRFGDVPGAVIEIREAARDD